MKFNTSNDIDFNLKNCNKYEKQDFRNIRERRLAAEDFEHLPSLIFHYSKKLGTVSDLEALMEHIGNARYVLLGEASHGTHEYYTWRMKITKRLIMEKGFSFIAVEGDWPDCYRVNR